MPEVRGAESPEAVLGVQRVAERRPAVVALLGGGLSDERAARPDVRAGVVPGGLNRLTRLVAERRRSGSASLRTVTCGGLLAHHLYASFRSSTVNMETILSSSSTE